MAARYCRTSGGKVRESSRAIATAYLICLSVGGITWHSTSAEIASVIFLASAALSSPSAAGTDIKSSKRSSAIESKASGSTRSWSPYTS